MNREIKKCKYHDKKSKQIFLTLLKYCTHFVSPLKFP